MSDDIRQNGTPSGEQGPGENSQPQPPPPPPGAYYYKPPPPPPYAQVGVPPPRRHRWLLPVGIGAGCLTLLILFAIVVAGAIGIGSGDGFGGGDHIRLIRVEGVITGGKSSEGLFGGGSAGSENLVSQLEKARKDDSCKAILIRINSPGGSAAGSEEVYDEIMRVRKKSLCLPRWATLLLRVGIT